jgi:AraC-like DNA-binding protein
MMYDLYAIVRDSLSYKKYMLNDLICVEYTCPVEEEHAGIYAEYDYLIHILSGKKRWTTTQGFWDMSPGDTLYVKKGAAIVTQDFEEQFCMLGFFLPDDLIREALEQDAPKVPFEQRELFRQFTAARISPENYLKDFIQSVLPYFREDREPPEAILKLKLKELIIQITYHCKDVSLKSYLRSVVLNPLPSLTHIMETNYCFNLTLEEYARLSHRSLSKFKSDFSKHYGTTPGKWLLNKRLDQAANQLVNSEENITQISFACGFEDVSHFSRAFRNKFGVPPRSYAKSLVK